MMGTVNLHNNNLVTGRVGELTDYANEATFKVVQRIFGYGGPYRKVLHKFGIGDLNNKKDYLQLKDGRIFCDIDMEAAVLWRPCSYRLRLSDNKVLTEFHYYGLLPLVGFLRKTVTEVVCIAFIEHYLRKMDGIYLEFAKEVEMVFNKGSLTLEKFLVLYEDVVFTSYLYELLFHYNNSKGFVERSMEAKIYVSANDFMLSEERGYAEFVYKLPQDFVLGVAVTPAPVSTSHTKFIPRVIPDYNGREKKEIKAELKLQCIKNNMRLKTNVLLYLLNKTVNLEA
jgi:hypothetical protein